MKELSYLFFCVVLVLSCSCSVLAQLATGTETGTVNGYLWTPARTGGVVNKASWDIVPTNKWIDVAGTKLSDLASQVEAAMPGWFDPSSNKWGAVAEAWNGVAYDEAGHRAWWVAAGGHANGANNGIYEFNAFKMQYSIEKMPSDSRQWSEDYARLKNTNSYGYCNESDQIYKQKKANGTISDYNDWFRDELYWDRQPTSRHVYSGAVYVPERNELAMAIRRMWRYSLTDHNWFSRVVAPGQNAYEAEVALGEENIVHYDQTRDQILALSCGSGGPYSNIFNMSQNVWLREYGKVIGHGWDWSSAADYRFNNTVTLFKAVEPDGPNNPSLGRYVSYDITTRVKLAEGTVQFGPGINRSHFENQDGVGMVYIPPLNRYWVVQSNETAGKIMTWLELDPTTTPWTYRMLKFDSPTPLLTFSRTLVRRRMVWLPSMNAIMWLGASEKNIAVYKFGPYVPPAPTSTVATSASTSTTTTTTTTTATVSATTASATTKTPSTTTTASTTTTTTTKTPSTTTTASATTKASSTTTTTSLPTATTSAATTTDAATSAAQPGSTSSTTGEQDGESSASALAPAVFAVSLLVAIFA